MAEPAFYRISDLSREFDITHRAIRFYEDRGLLTPARKNGQRIYSSRDRTRLRLILRGKRLGFSLAEISELIELYQSSDDSDKQLRALLEKIRLRKQKLYQQQRDIDTVLADLSLIEQQCIDQLKLQNPEQKTRLRQPPVWASKIDSLQPAKQPRSTQP